MRRHYKISIIREFDVYGSKRFPVCEKNEGFAPDLKTAGELLNLSGWIVGVNCESYMILVETQPSNISLQLPPHKDIFVLNNRLHLN